jgi:hypothetical protein
MADPERLEIAMVQTDMKIKIPSHLSDAELVAGVKRFAAGESEATAQLVGHLAELDSRELYKGAGFSSLFGYCCEILHLSEHESYLRIEAARTARKFPVILDLLGDGSVNLTTVRLLAQHLTSENHERLLAEATHQSKRAVEELVARRFPRPDIASTVRKLPAPRSTAHVASAVVYRERAVSATEPRAAHGVAPQPISSVVDPVAVVSPPSPPRQVVTPLAEDRYAIQFTASTRTRDKLRLAQDLLRHTIPTGDTAEIIDRALTLLLEDVARKKFASTERPRLGRGVDEDSRYVPAEVRRAVWLRDGDRCAFVSSGGRRCAERGLLEFHHVVPYAVGGKATVDNLQLRCRAHNAYEAKLYFGPYKSSGEGLVRETTPTCLGRSERTRSGPSSPRTERSACLVSALRREGDSTSAARAH